MESKRRILFVSAKGGFFGGVERYIHDTARILAEGGYEAIGMFESEARDVEKFATPFKRIYRFSDADRIIGKERFDLVYIHKVDDPDLLARLRRSYRTAVFVHDHDYYCLRRHKYFPVTRTNCRLPFNCLYCSVCSCLMSRTVAGIRPINLLRRMRTLKEIRKCDAFVVMSGFMRHNLIKNHFAEQLIYKIYPIREPVVGKNKERLVSVPPVITYVGQLIRGKGVDLMLRALALLTLDYRAVIVGSNNDDDFLKGLARELGIDDKVEFAGWQTDPGKFWRDADLAVFPSRWQEPFGLTGIEAFSYSLPVVGFDVGGVTEWLHDNENGLLAPAKDVVALADAIQKLLCSPERASKLGQAGYRFVKDHFSADQFLQSFDFMLSKLMEQD